MCRRLRESCGWYCSSHWKEPSTPARRPTAVWSSESFWTDSGGKTSPQPARLAAFRSYTHANCLGFKIILEHLAAHLAAPARLLVAAKGQRRVEDVVAIDPDRAGSQLIGDAMGTLDVAGPQARGQPVHGVVGAANQ